MVGGWEGITNEDLGVKIKKVKEKPEENNIKTGNGLKNASLNCDSVPPSEVIFKGSF